MKISYHMNNILILPCSRWESSSSSLVKSGAKALASRHIKRTLVDMFIILSPTDSQWARLAHFALLDHQTPSPETLSLQIRNDCILRIYKLWQPNKISSVTDCVLKLLLKQVFKKISILQGNLKHIASITVSCAILTMCHNFRKGTSNIWQAESDKWLRIHLGFWFFDQFQTFILSHVIDFYINESI